MESKRNVKYITKKKKKKQNKKLKNLSLEISMNDESIQLYKDEKVVCIRDKFPKAKFHALLIPISSSEENNFINFSNIKKITVQP